MKFILDLLRELAALLDWRGYLRVLRGKGKYDVAFIGFIEDDFQKQLTWMHRSRKGILYGRQFVQGRNLCRHLLINRSPPVSATRKSQWLIQYYIRTAITAAIRDGAKIILLGQDVRQLLTENELAVIRSDYFPVIVEITGSH